jgi:hypothetical protein
MIAVRIIHALPTVASDLGGVEGAVAGFVEPLWGAEPIAGGLVTGVGVGCAESSAKITASRIIPTSQTEELSACESMSANLRRTIRIPHTTPAITRRSEPIPKIFILKLIIQSGRAGPVSWDSHTVICLVITKLMISASGSDGVIIKDLQKAIRVEFIESATITAGFGAAGSGAVKGFVELGGDGGTIVHGIG